MIYIMSLKISHFSDKQQNSVSEVHADKKRQPREMSPEAQLVPPLVERMTWDSTKLGQSPTIPTNTEVLATKRH